MQKSLPEMDIEQLSVAQRLELISQLWDSIPDTIEALPLPDWHREMIERRLASADASPESAIPWERVKARLRERP